MQVLPSFENLFSATGYLGEAPNINHNYDNGYEVFSGSPYAYFNGTQINHDSTSSTYLSGFSANASDVLAYAYVQPTSGTNAFWGLDSSAFETRAWFTGTSYQADWIG